VCICVPGLFSLKTSQRLSVKVLGTLLQSRSNSMTEVQLKLLYLANLAAWSARSDVIVNCGRIRRKET
jgi:hypothetical protein